MSEPAIAIVAGMKRNDLTDYLAEIEVYCSAIYVSRGEEPVR